MRASSQSRSSLRRELRSPPIGSAATLPVRRNRCAHRTTLLTPMLNRLAASRQLAPVTTAATTRVRRSSEYGFVIHPGPPPARILNHDKALLGIPPDSVTVDNALAAARPSTAREASRCG